MIVDTIEKAEEFLRHLDTKASDTRKVVVDLETTGLDMFGLEDRKGEEEQGIGPARTAGIAVALDSLDTFYLPFRHESPEPQLPLVFLFKTMDVIRRSRALLINHNLKFDLKVLDQEGLTPLDEQEYNLSDTMLLAYVLNEERDSYTLESLCGTELGIVSDWKRELKAEFKTKKLRRYSQFAVTRLAEYAEEDAGNTFMLHEKLRPLLLKEDKPIWGGPALEEIYARDIELLWTLMRMEIKGIKIDRQRCQELSDRLGAQLEIVHKQINDFVGEDFRTKVKLSKSGEITKQEIVPFLVSSNKQMREFFQTRNWPIPKNEDTGAPTFADLTLMRQEFNDAAYKEFVKLVGTERGMSKFKNTYYDSYLELADESDFLHPSYNQHGTNTARLSSSHPNFQNVPKTWASARHSVQKSAEDMVQSEVRTVIIPRDSEHRFVAFDYSQQEIRMFLHYANEENMRRIVTSGDTDIHTWTAQQMFGVATMGPKKLPDGSENINFTRYRHFAKTVVFGILYGMGKEKLARSMELSKNDAVKYWDMYMSMFPQVREFMTEVSSRAKEKEYIKYWSGRRRRMRRYNALELSERRTKTAVGYMKILPGQTVDVHKALNSLIQGGCADLTRQSMVRVDHLLKGTKSHLVNQVHDDILLEIHEDELQQLIPEIKHCLEDWPLFKVPFVADMKAAPRPGASWAEAKGSGA